MNINTESATENSINHNLNITYQTCGIDNVGEFYKDKFAYAHSFDIQNNYLYEYDILYLKQMYVYEHIKPNSIVLDFGCGIGRHTNQLIKYGYDIVGIDYSEVLLAKAKQLSQKKENFIAGDCRDINLNTKYDTILCLYDVVGSFIDNLQNIKILANIYNHLADDGYTLISVMKYELTKAQAIHTFSLQNQHNKLLELTASDTMEQTGDVFDPRYYMIDKETNIVYRAEQFNTKNKLPQELIVRDYRYTKKEIEQMCIDVGLEVVFSRYVQAGRWQTVPSLRC